jgi:hypothetical protein
MEVTAWRRLKQTFDKTNKTNSPQNAMILVKEPLF